MSHFYTPKTSENLKKCDTGLKWAKLKGNQLLPPAFTFLKSKMETIEECVKSVQGYINKYTRKTELTRYFRVFIVDFKQVNAE